MAGVDATVAQIIAVNLARADEGLRVAAQDVRSRFDDRRLTALIEQLRDDLAAAAKDLPAAEAGDARHTPDDAAAGNRAESRQHETSPEETLRAATRHIAEAMRVVEEYGEIADPGLAGSMKALRRRTYELDKCIQERGQLRSVSSRCQIGEAPSVRARFRDVQLYVLLTESLCRGPWWEAAAAAIEGGADCIQLREPALGDAELFSRAARLAVLCQEQDVLFVVNDRPDVARLAQADGVHVGQHDLPVAAAREIVGANALVGKSTHTLDQVKSAMQEAPDYIAVGPMFASSTKPQGHIAGLATLRQATRLLDVPHVAIGGITAQHLPSLLAAGCRCVAVCQAVIAQSDVRAAAREFKELLQRADGPDPSALK